MRYPLLATLLLTACASGSTEDPSTSSEALTATPTKTQLTANNTSASPLFRDLYTPAKRFDGEAIGVVSNGDNPTSAMAATTLADGAISKLSLHRLLPAAPAAKIFFETQSWFCTNGASPLASGLAVDQCGDHIDIGYDTSSRVPTQVADMRSRGADGAIVDWHGPVAGENESALAAFKTAAEGTGGAFKLAVMEDEGVKACAAKPGCDVAQAVLADIAYLASNYFPSSAYYRVDNRPVLFFFGIDGYVTSNGKPALDWDYIRAHAAGNPLFVFQGYKHGQADGDYGWPSPTDIAGYPGKDPFGASNLRDFYAQAHAPLVFGSGYKGFDDHVVNGWDASGNGERYLGQQCGKTWLDTFAAANARSGLTALQVATWDDYEEGTETETGIANHLAITPHVSGSMLSWTLAATSDAPKDCKDAITGGFDIGTTVDHFAIYASTDGEHMTLLADNLAATTRSFDVAGKVGPFYVRAIGKPSITNTLSGPAAGAAPPPPPAGCTGVPTILEPTSDGKVGPSIRLRATGPACFETMIAYIDGKQVWQVDGSSTDQWIPVSMGPHTVNVNAWAGTSEAHVSAPVSFVRTY